MIRFCIGFGGYVLGASFLWDGWCRVLLAVIGLLLMWHGDRLLDRQTENDSI